MCSLPPLEDSERREIRTASDDAAGLKISEKMRAQIRGLRRGAQNTQEGISWVQVGDGAMHEILDIVQRIRELAVQASNDTNNLEDREAINDEIKQLKKEINRISLDTEFNKQEVFQNEITIKADGSVGDLQIFNATYDDATGQVSYGGFIFSGNRVTWDAVSSGMVVFDTNGKQVFTGGTYEYVEPNSGTRFEIVCDAGAETPRVTRKLSMSAGADGIMIDGTKHGWEELVNVDGENIWELKHEGATLTFFIPDVYRETGFVQAMNKACERYDWRIAYSGSEDVKAVDASVIRNVRLSNYTVSKMIDEDFSYTVKADDTGIWLEESTNPGVKVAGSGKTWAELGISSWDSGNDISCEYTYHYTDSEGSTDDTYISFNFKLDDVTSCDSVIDGLDGMIIGGKNITNSYAATQDVQLDSNILSAAVVGGDKKWACSEQRN